MGNILGNKKKKVGPAGEEKGDNIDIRPKKKKGDGVQNS